MLKNVESGSQKNADRIRTQNTGDLKQMTKILIFTKVEVRTLKCCIVLQNTGLKHSEAGNQCRHQICTE